MFSREKFHSQLIQVLHLKESPHRTALAFAIGVFIAFSPTYGLHTLSAVFCAWIFRLNFLAVFLGALVNNPWTIAPILAMTLWTGFHLLGTSNTLPLNWDEFTIDNIGNIALPYLLPFAVGGLALSVAGALLAYPLAFIAVSRYRKNQAV